MIFLAHAVWDPPVTSNGIHHGAQVQYLDRIVKLVFLMVTQWRSHRPTLKVDQYQSKNGLFFSRFADHRSCKLLIAFEVFCLSMLEYFLNRAGAHFPNSKRFGQRLLHSSDGLSDFLQFRLSGKAVSPGKLSSLI
ncbi:hypothetical protein BASA81_010626 [Batrachochytrium salamandrivorans]|nr:hypothetical protein BASA81_010626 [Batrachochytrium salamandrivorans]